MRNILIIARRDLRAQFNSPVAYVVIGGAMLLLGVGFAPLNEGAATFFVFASAFVPFAVEAESTALKLLATVLAVATLEWWLLHLSGWFLFYGGGLSMVVGASNIYFAQRNRANEPRSRQPRRRSG